MKYKLYEVGGRIRDFYLGVKSKDVDYSVVFERPEAFYNAEAAFHWFNEELIKLGYNVVKLNIETFTIRAKFPSGHKHSGVADFVIARKELSYIPNTRTPVVELGTLRDDLERRDFTVNAMARDEDGVIIDLFNGQEDLIKGILKTPKDAIESFNNDPLRILRVFRFCITKSFNMSDAIIDAIKLFDSNRLLVVSKDRIRDEFTKMFKSDTRLTLIYLEWLRVNNYALYDTVIDSFWLLPTNKK